VLGDVVVVVWFVFWVMFYFDYLIEVVIIIYKYK
jgi:hypothetical protein